MLTSFGQVLVVRTTGDTGLMADYGAELRELLRLGGDELGCWAAVSRKLFAPFSGGGVLDQFEIGVLSGRRNRAVEALNAEARTVSTLGGNSVAAPGAALRPC